MICKANQPIRPIFWNFKISISSQNVLSACPLPNPPVASAPTLLLSELQPYYCLNSNLSIVCPPSTYCLKSVVLWSGPHRHISVSQIFTNRPLFFIRLRQADYCHKVASYQLISICEVKY